MNTYVVRFRDILLDGSGVDPHDDRLVIERSDRMACHYAPFDHVNLGAKIVLLGLTPGTQQASNAINALRTILQAGTDYALGLQEAKRSASFCGPMRKNLVAMLDRIGMQRTLDIETCARLFDSHTDLVHFTSALRYPVFLDGKNYSGSPSIMATPALRAMTRRWLGVEIAQLQGAFWIPLGKEPAAVLADFVERGELRKDRVLAGMPHPSGANAERIAYFLGTKDSNNLSTKTNPVLLDAARDRLIQLVSQANRNAGIEKEAPSEISPRKTHAFVERSISNARPKDANVARVPRATVQPRQTEERDYRIATTFRLVGHSGESIHPVRIKNRKTGRIAFILAPRGAGTHKREHAVEVLDEAMAYQMVRSGTYKIRATRRFGEAPSLLGLGDRAVKDVVRI